MIENLTSLQAGMPIVFGGDRVAHVSDELAAVFAPGDRLVIVQDTGDLLHIPQDEYDVATGAVEAAVDAFAGMGTVGDDQISAFYEAFAARLASDDTFAPIKAANDEDVARGKAAGRSTTRLVLSDKMRKGMIDGLRMWAKAPTGRGAVTESIEHTGWRVDLVRAGIGVVGFVFEGRPNVFADATGVMRSGNTVVFRIGSAALGTARAIVANALDPALEESGLPPGAASLVDSAAHAAGWALFADPRLALARRRFSARRRGPPGRHRRQPPRHRWCLDRRCRLGRSRGIWCGGVPFTRPQGVQHAQHLRHCGIQSR
jgi:glutamate-5-semialdehyde dehydrogenase